MPEALGWLDDGGPDNDCGHKESCTPCASADGATPLEAVCNLLLALKEAGKL